MKKEKKKRKKEKIINIKFVICFASFDKNWKILRRKQNLIWKSGGGRGGGEGT